MKISYLILTTTALFFLVSCNNSKSPDTDKSLMDTYNTAAPTNSPDSNAEANGSGFTVETNNINPENLQQAPAEVYQAAGLNPPHGQPGHDCAIAVGAPLKGSAATNRNTAPAAAPSPVVNFPTSPVSAPVSGSGRLNPAHGQPGHDCAIPVGAPLS